MCSNNINIFTNTILGVIMMPQKKQKNTLNSTKSDITMISSKTNPLNDGVKNANKQQNLNAKLNMPRGAKKPENTPK